MSATPPEASTEYSRGLGGSSPAASDFSGALRALVLGASVLGAVLLVVSEFTTLFNIQTATGGTIKSVGTGSHDSYALIPIALLAVALAWGAVTSGSRWALIALGVLGVVALLIALIGDLPDAQATGTIGSAASGFHAATDKPSAGLYIETFGAIMLVIGAGCGLLLMREALPEKAPRRRAELAVPPVVQRAEPEPVTRGVYDRARAEEAPASSQPTTQPVAPVQVRARQGGLIGAAKRLMRGGRR